MAWTTPKTDYQPTDPIDNLQVNKREANLVYLKSEADSIRADYDANIDQGVKTTDSPVFANMASGSNNNQDVRTTASPTFASVETPSYKLASGQVLAAPTAGTTYTLMRVQEAVETTGETAYLDPDRYFVADVERQLSVKVLIPGTITVTLQHATSVGETGYVRFLKNGVQITEYTTTVATYTTRTENIAVTFGDIITVQQKHSGILTSGWKNIFIKSGTQTFAVA